MEGTIKIGNAPCSWGVEFADDARNPPWRRVLEECAAAGYAGIELGPVGYMPEDPPLVAEALQQHGLELIAGVVFQPFHAGEQWDQVRDAAERTCRALVSHGARQLVLIDSIASQRASTAGRGDEAVQLDDIAWKGFVERIETVAKIATFEHGLTVSIHPHAGGFMDFHPEVERLLQDVDESLLKLCVDTGHSLYAGFDPLAFLREHAARVSYVHFKNTDGAVRARAIEERTGFYEACAQGIFCHLAQGELDFAQVKAVLHEMGYRGWCTVEQDCDPAGETRPVLDAKANRAYLASMGL